MSECVRCGKREIDEQHRPGCFEGLTLEQAVKRLVACEAVLRRRFEECAYCPSPTGELVWADELEKALHG